MEGVEAMLAMIMSLASSLLQVSGGKTRDTGNSGAYARESKRVVIRFQNKSLSLKGRF